MAMPRDPVGDAIREIRQRQDEAEKRAAESWEGFPRLSSFLLFVTWLALLWLLLTMAGVVQPAVRELANPETRGAVVVALLILMGLAAAGRSIGGTKPKGKD